MILSIWILIKFYPYLERVSYSSISWSEIYLIWHLSIPFCVASIFVGDIHSPTSFWQDLRNSSILSSELRLSTFSCSMISTSACGAWWWWWWWWSCPCEWSWESWWLSWVCFYFFWKILGFCWSDKTIRIIQNINFAFIIIL